MSPIHAQKTQRGFNSRVALLDGSEAQCGEAEAEASYVAGFPVPLPLPPGPPVRLD